MLVDLCSLAGYLVIPPFHSQISSNLQELDSCSVNVFPNLNPDHEEITLRETADGPSTSSDIKAQMNRDGVELVGFDTIARFV